MPQAFSHDGDGDVRVARTLVTFVYRFLCKCANQFLSFYAFAQEVVRCFHH